MTRAALASIALLLCGLVVPACDPPVEVTPEPNCCAPGQAAIFLRSKVDDDDGDGNPFDEDPETINDEDDDIADHAWIRDAGGTFHLFFQNEGHGAGRSSIEHYTSTDLKQLRYVGVALSPEPSGWDSYGLWAPHVVEHGGVYFMFYTGTTGVGPDAEQRIGLATSADLVTWTRFAASTCPDVPGVGCVYDCDEPWTTWGNGPGSYDRQCRDPFVTWDVDAGAWLLLATAKSRNGYGTIVAARSHDLVAWTGAGYIDATRRLPDGIGAQTTGGQCENPFVFGHGGASVLLFSDWWDPEDHESMPAPRSMVQYAVSATLAVDSTGSHNWFYTGPIPDPGVNAIEAVPLGGGELVLSQSISNLNTSHYPSRTRQLRLKCVDWRPAQVLQTHNVSAACLESLLGQ